MKREIDYNKYAEPEKTQIAVADVKQYLSRKQFKAVVALLTGEGEFSKVANRKQHFLNACDLFLGIEGYPVGAMLRTYYKE